LVNCKFAGYAIGFDFWSRFTSTITGLDFNISNLLKIGERIYNLERLFNNAAGFNATDDILPERFLNQSFKEGLSKDRTVNLSSMLKDYYAVRKWDEHGVPKPEKLKELGLDQIL
jgi:aldehyde:ferredoxin oxidoreductase